MIQPRREWHEWLPDAAAGLTVAAVGLVIVTVNYRAVAAIADAGSGRAALLLAVAVGMGAAVGLSRLAPGAALALVWAITAAHIGGGIPIVVTEVAVAFVAFGTARWGGTVVVWLSALSIPTGAIVAIAFLARPIREVLSVLIDLTPLERLGEYGRLGGVVIGAALLGVPWLAGLVLRVTAGARAAADLASADLARAEAGRAQAGQVARLREEQARLARDVHDVVGHSLAVILAQAESGQYLPDGDPAALKATLANIATAARASLQSVRHVLSATGEPATTSASGLDGLIDGFRTTAHEVVATQLGTPRPLPPELEVTAFRVLQEMITNAMTHGRRDHPVTVERRWPDVAGSNETREQELRISMSNAVRTDPGAAPPRAAGRGLIGMRQRLELVGGRLEVEQGETTFTVTAWIPVRTRP